MSLLVQVGCCEGSRIVGLAMTTRCISVGTGYEAPSRGHVVSPLSVVVCSMIFSSTIRFMFHFGA